MLCFRAKHRQHYIFAGRVSEPRKSALLGVSEPHVPELVERSMDLNDEEADHARESADGCGAAKYDEETDAREQWGGAI